MKISLNVGLGILLILIFLVLPITSIIAHIDSKYNKAHMPCIYYKVETINYGFAINDSYAQRIMNKCVYPKIEVSK